MKINEKYFQQIYGYNGVWIVRSVRPVAGVTRGAFTSLSQIYHIMYILLKTCRYE